MEQGLTADAEADAPGIGPRLPASDLRGQLKQFRSRLVMSEFSGALGDLGTFIPIIVALAVQYDLSFPATLMLAGGANLATGFLFDIPVRPGAWRLRDVISLPQQICSLRWLRTGPGACV